MELRIIRRPITGLTLYYIGDDLLAASVLSPECLTGDSVLGYNYTLHPIHPALAGQDAYTRFCATQNQADALAAYLHEAVVLEPCRRVVVPAA